jgi:putative Holliday junction resolvase
MAFMRYLGIDYGSKRIGLAISDEAETMAFPHEVVANDKRTMAVITDLCEANKIKTIIMGNSQNYKGEDNAIMEEVHAFTELLKSKNYEVIFEAEVLSTMQAERLQGKRSDIDASAAAIILQSYLDRQKYRRKHPKDKGENDEYRQKLQKPEPIQETE